MCSVKIFFYFYLIIRWFYCKIYILIFFDIKIRLIVVKEGYMWVFR